MRGLWFQTEVLRRWFKGVEEQRQPALQRYLRRNLRGYALCQLAMPLVFVSPHLSDLEMLSRWQVWSLVVAGLCSVGLCAAAFSRFGERWSGQAVLVYTAAHIVSLLGFTHEREALYLQGVVAYVGVPCLIAAFLPLRPVFLLFLGCVVAALVGFAQGILLGAGLAKVVGVVVWGLAFGVVGAVASQRQRRLWCQFGGQQEALFAMDRVADLGQRTVTLAAELERPLQEALVQLTEALGGARELVEVLEGGEEGAPALRHLAAQVQPQVRASSDRLLDMGQRLQSIREQTRASAPSQGYSPLVSAQRALVPVTARERAQLIQVRAQGEVSSLTLEGEPLRFEQVLSHLAAHVRGQSPGAALSVTLEVREEALWVLLGRHEVELDVRLVSDFQELLRRARSAEEREGLTLCRDIAQGVFEGDLRAVRGGGVLWVLSLRQRVGQVREGWAPQFGLGLARGEGAL